MNALDRRNTLLTNHTVLGIDYLFVDPGTQTTIDVHFIFPPDASQQALINLGSVTIASVLGDAPPVGLTGIAFVTIDGATVARITTARPGTFTRYRLAIADPDIGPPLMDPYFSSLVFSFKAGCHSDLDCDEGPAPCPPEPETDFPVDYQARDFWSFRTALLDFASQRYPSWKDRLEADAGVMLAEVMSALGDEFAYYQDRIAREAYNESASQRRSLRWHTRLVDYAVHDGLGASTWIDVTALANGNLTAGTSLYAVRDGVNVYYSVGRNLDEMLDAPVHYHIAVGLNALAACQWDVHDVCLAAGTTELYLKGDVTALLLPFNDIPTDPKRAPGRWLLLRTDPADPSLPRRRHLVRVTQVNIVHDPLAGIDTTHIVWEASQALPFQIDFSMLRVRGNLIPAVAGRRMEQYFLIGDGTDTLPLPGQNPPFAVERLGANGTVTFLFSLPGTDSDGLVRRGDPTAPTDPRNAVPELYLTSQTPKKTGGYNNAEPWDWRPSFLGITSSLPLDKDYILDDGFYRRIVGYRYGTEEFAHIDYASNDGSTIRFGDNVFGATPARGTRFRARYLVGNGRRANLPAGAITNFDPSIAALVSAIDNPFAVENGVDPETLDSIRQLAPEEFRATTYRAVRPEDYAEAVERLDWVQRAGCTFRWTGSWLTAFVAADPLGGLDASDDERVEMEDQLDRFRQAGREVVTRDPVYADIDLKITFCVAPDAYPAEVLKRVAAALIGTPGAFFSDDNFTFGTPLDRARLEAAIQDVAGVRAVESISFRRRGVFGWQPFSTMIYRAAPHEVIRVENDPLHPDRGSIQLTTDGGA